MENYQYALRYLKEISQDFVTLANEVIVYYVLALPACIQSVDKLFHLFLVNQPDLSTRETRGRTSSFDVFSPELLLM